MMTFLFWNLNQKPLKTAIVRLATKHDIDLLILVECAIAPGEMLFELNEGRTPKYHLTDSRCDKVVVYTRFSRRFIKPAAESGRYTIRRLILPGRPEVILAAVHFPSKLYWSSESQSFECVEFARTVRDLEEQVGHRRTILVGDFNMNPFEAGLIAASGLNAVMTRQIASRMYRTVQGREYPFFYNPMWGHFGDALEGPSGTYYYERAQHSVLESV